MFCSCFFFVIVLVFSVGICWLWNVFDYVFLLGLFCFLVFCGVIFVWG